MFRRTWPLPQSRAHAAEDRAPARVCALALYMGLASGSARTELNEITYSLHILKRALFAQLTRSCTRNKRRQTATSARANPTAVCFATSINVVIVLDICGDLNMISFRPRAVVASFSCSEGPERHGRDTIEYGREYVPWRGNTMMC
jgi:hypothetical protein